VPEYVVVLIRTIFSFIVLLAMTRLMGKTQMSQLTFFDYVVGITIGSVAATLSVDQNVKILNGLVSIVIWGLLPILIAFINMKSYRFRKITDGNPTPLIQNGNILEDNLKKTRLTSEELMLMLRQKDAFKLADVEFAVLETSGQLSVMKKSDVLPVTPKDMQIKVELEHEPRVIIMDGKVMEKTLTDLGYSKEWLLGEVMKHGAEQFQDVYFAQITSDGSLYIDLRRDHCKQIPVSQKVLARAAMQKVQADLQLFSLETRNSDAKAMFMEQAHALENILHDLRPYLKG
jgi:uncharacterized membrane protein YcaP (DUF421 family)